MNMRMLSAIATVLLTCSPSLSESGSVTKSHEVVASREGRIAPGVVAGFIGLFSPEPTGPDYELTLVTKESGPLRNVTQTIRRHREWFRVDKSDGDATSTQHVHLPTGTVVEFGRTFIGVVTYMAVRAPPQEGTGRIDYDSFRTGKFDTVLGEGCEIWAVYRGVEAGVTTFTHFSCVTADGIELSRRTTSRSGGELGKPETAMSLVRRAVQPSEVEPPQAILSLTPWIAPPSDIAAGTPGEQADVEITLESDDGREARTIRRHFPWTLEERRRSDGSRSFQTLRSDGWVHISARLGPAGQPESFGVSRRAGLSSSPSVPLQRPPTTILGLSCTWFDLAPGRADGGLHECRTSDGWVLSAKEYWRGGSRRFTAVSISRRPLTISDVLPPQELLDLKSWAVH